MNSLGLEYGLSSSDEEENVASASPIPTEPRAPSSPVPATSIIATPALQASATIDEAPIVQSDENTAEEAVESTELDVSMSDGDEELMLLRAGIPPATASLASDNETQQRIERFLCVQHERGQDFQTTLQDKKEVRNPYILEKVVEYFGIDELQSNFSPNKFDPHGLPLHEYADALSLEQKKRADKRAQRQLQQQRDGADTRQLEFISARALN
ncbi:unnamed protein product [Peronospora belbahrii]|uniref:Uncharacterized protein n=1 Tax=Peronospora belbahrii TaxID=622444 RepID=A0AAU9KPG5_9STRA|nr:unnamed protein product [Peronospora belbahrii]CAH0520013.1 unnamed protein product [Peronospora belbahrii]